MRIIGEDKLRDATLLIFANKQDLPNAMNCAGNFKLQLIWSISKLIKIILFHTNLEITDKLSLHSLRSW